MDAAGRQLYVTNNGANILNISLDADGATVLNCTLIPSIGNAISLSIVTDGAGGLYYTSAAASTPVHVNAHGATFSLAQNPAHNQAQSWGMTIDLTGALWFAGAQSSLTFIGYYSQPITPTTVPTIIMTPSAPSGVVNTSTGRVIYSVVSGQVGAYLLQPGYY